MTHRRLTLDVSRNGITHLGGLELHAWSVDGTGKKTDNTSCDTDVGWSGAFLFCSMLSPFSLQSSLLYVSFALCVLCFLCLSCFALFCYLSCLRAFIISSCFVLSACAVSFFALLLGFLVFSFVSFRFLAFCLASAVCSRLVLIPCKRVSLWGM